MREKKNSQRDYPKLFIFEITTGETSETTPGEQDIGRNDRNSLQTVVFGRFGRRDAP